MSVERAEVIYDARDKFFPEYPWCAATEGYLTFGARGLQSNGNLFFYSIEQGTVSTFDGQANELVGVYNEIVYTAGDGFLFGFDPSSASLVLTRLITSAPVSDEYIGCIVGSVIYLIPKELYYISSGPRWVNSWKLYNIVTDQMLDITPAGLSPAPRFSDGVSNGADSAQTATVGPDGNIYISGRRRWLNGAALPSTVRGVMQLNASTLSLSFTSSPNFPIGQPSVLDGKFVIPQEDNLITVLDYPNALFTPYSPANSSSRRDSWSDDWFSYNRNIVFSARAVSSSFKKMYMPASQYSNMQITAPDFVRVYDAGSLSDSDEVVGPKSHYEMRIRKYNPEIDNWTVGVEAPDGNLYFIGYSGILRIIPGKRATGGWKVGSI
jgi:hypothetical protein